MTFYEFIKLHKTILTVYVDLSNFEFYISAARPSK
jgi:hypothetical protein